MCNWSVIHGIKRKPHLSVVWNWYHFVAIAILHQPRPTDSADINTRLQLSDTSSIPPMHGGFLLLSILSRWTWCKCRICLCVHSAAFHGQIMDFELMKQIAWNSQGHMPVASRHHGSIDSVFGWCFVNSRIYTTTRNFKPELHLSCTNPSMCEPLFFSWWYNSKWWSTISPFKLRLIRQLSIDCNATTRVDGWKVSFRLSVIVLSCE